MQTCPVFILTVTQTWVWVPAFQVFANKSTKQCMNGSTCFFCHLYHKPRRGRARHRGRRQACRSSRTSSRCLQREGPEQSHLQQQAALEKEPCQFWGSSSSSRPLSAKEALHFLCDEAPPSACSPAIETQQLERVRSSSSSCAAGDDSALRALLLAAAGTEAGRGETVKRGKPTGCTRVAVTTTIAGMCDLTLIMQTE